MEYLFLTMSRLILVPQFPTRMRYQEWWWTEFPKQFKFYFNEVVVLGAHPDHFVYSEGSEIFSPIRASVAFEISQIEQYMALELKDGDVLLLNDLSFPGLFANVLFHKKPKHCFAICHGTSKNRYDYFSKVRKSKWAVESGISKLFDRIIVGSQYHATKLGWKNISVIPFPTLYKDIPMWSSRREGIVCVSRPGIQKVNKRLEDMVEKELSIKIARLDCKTWDSYYLALSKFQVMLITSKEETFGYQVIDAIIGGCVPIAPNACSYPEILPEKYLYNNEQEMVCLIQQVFDRKLRGLRKINDSKFYSKVANLMIK